MYIRSSYNLLQCILYFVIKLTNLLHELQFCWSHANIYSSVVHIFTYSGCFKYWITLKILSQTVSITIHKTVWKCGELPRAVNTSISRVVQFSEFNTYIQCVINQSIVAHCQMEIQSIHHCLSSFLSWICLLGSSVNYTVHVCELLNLYSIVQVLSYRVTLPIHIIVIFFFIPV